MKKILHNISLVLGFILLLGGFLLYALNKHEYVDVGIEKLPIVIIIFGIGFVVGGSCELFIKQSREAQIEANDERNIMIAKTAKAFAFDIMIVLFSTVIVVLVLFDLITMMAFMTLFSVYGICQIIFVYKLWSLQKRL